MSSSLLVGITGLALLDSLNPATIVAVTLVLIAAPRRPALVAGAAVLGAALTVFGTGAAIFLTLGAAADVVDGLVVALRFLAFGAAGLALVVAGVRRLRDRRRVPISLPSWFSPRTAIPFGAVLTAADLPNAFPFFIAIERMVDAHVEPGPGLLVLAGYALLYCLPCLALLAAGLGARDRVRSRLDSIVTRAGTGNARRSIPLAAALALLGLVVASIPFWLL